MRARARVVLSPSGSREITPREGHVVSSKRDETFVDILSKVSNPPALIGQTGLNAGHSAQILLDKFVSAAVVSFQLRGGRNTKIRKLFANTDAYLEARFGHRHHTVCGNSRKTMPRFEGNAVAPVFDICFIDGNQSRCGAEADIDNFMQLCRRGALVIMDDVHVVGKGSRSKKDWENGPTDAWVAACKDGHIVGAEYANGMAWGCFAN